MLEIWEARRLDRVLASGRTKPLLLECVLPGSNLAGYDEATRLMVVKALGPPEVTEIGLICQMYGNLLARELGVLAPECAIVNISPQLSDAMRPRQGPPGLSAGLGVGSEYLRGGLTTVVAGMTLMPDEVRQAACLYAFDMLVQNPDRHRGNPNCAFIGKDIYAYDFDTCFSFVLVIGQQAEA